MDLQAVQQALRESGADGWLFYDFHHRDPLAYRILGLDMEEMATRRWFYWIPAHGEPVKLVHKVEPRKLDALPGDKVEYLGWRELHEALKKVLASARRIAMQYSPMANVPTVSLVDGGTVEMVRSLGFEVVTSADLVQRFEAVIGDDGWHRHCEAGEKVQRIKDEAFQLMDEALRNGRVVTEHNVKEFILARFEEEGLTSDGDVPIVGFNDHPVDPHFTPTEENAYRLHHGDTILVDLWARMDTPRGVYYDITWCGFAGREPQPLHQEIFRVVREARDAAVEFLESRFAEGRPCFGYEVDDVCRRVVHEAGYAEYFLHRTGHSIGREVHGNGANLDNLETRDERRIIPGTCFSIEPGIYLPTQMAVRSEINVYIDTAGKVKIYGPRQAELLRVG